MGLVWKFVVICAYLVNFTESQSELYIGKTSGKVFYAVRSSTHWSECLDHCLMFRLRPGSLLTVGEHKTVTDYLARTPDLPAGRLWLPATDYQEEGTFRWMINKEEVTVGNWSAGMPSGNRSANCLAVNKDGLYEEGRCGGQDIRSHCLCELPTQQYNDDVSVPENLSVLNKSNSSHQPFKTHSAETSFTKALTPIGGVGAKQFFVIDEPDYFLNILDYCHEIGMRMASLETSAEIKFVRDYVSAEFENVLDSYLHIGASDILSVSCNRSNKGFRWLYSGELVPDEIVITSGNTYRYNCVHVSQNGFSSSTCMVGGGAPFRGLCELKL